MAVDRNRVRLTERLRPWAYLGPLLVFLTGFALLPVVVLFATSIDSAGTTGVAAAWANPLNQAAMANSLSQGLLSALAAVAVGYPTGVLLGRYDWPGRRLARAFLIVPFLLPSVVVVFGVEDLVGAHGVVTGLWEPAGFLGSGIPGIIAVNVLFNAPLVALLTTVGIESASEPLEEVVATLGGSPARRFRDVWGPPSWMGAAAGGLLTFVFSALSFAPPLLLCGPRCYTMEARVWALVQVFLSPSEAALVALAMVGILVVPTAVYLGLLGRLRPAGMARERRPRPIPWRAPALWPVIAAGAFVLLSVAALLGAILDRALVASGPGGSPGSAWAYLFGSHLTAVLGLSTAGVAVNSLWLAAAASGIALVLGLVAGVRRSTASGAVRVYRWLPLLISPVVLSFALTGFWRPWLGGSSQVWILILLAQATLAIPFALPGLDVALAGVPPRYRDSAASVGAPPLTAYLEGEVPFIRPALVTAGLFAFALCLGEFTATNFLSTPSFTTLPVELYRLEGLRLTGPADALAGLLVLVSLAALAAAQRGGERALL
jgi:thiamine transport system permease protein